MRVFIMKIYTFQLAKWRKVKALNIPYLDTSIKSGEWKLAPTKELLYSYKYGETTPEQYTVIYNTLLEERYLKYPNYFQAILNKEVIALGCYCGSKEFCHRHLLLEFLERITSVERCGEIE